MSRNILGIYGPAGNGKTTIIKEGIAKAMDKPFIFISLGGAQDRATLAGSNYVYEGSSCGKIIQSIKVNGWVLLYSSINSWSFLQSAAY